MKVIIGILFIAALGTSCQKEKCTASYVEGCLCTQHYDPVCGCDGVTYGNSCEAVCNSIQEFTEGECD